MAITFNMDSTPKPPKIILYGQPKIGKSTWASQAPNPVFVLTEDGLGEINVPHYPLANKFDAIIANLCELAEEDHDRKTVVIDSLDWLESLVFDKVCEEMNVKSIEDIGYAKGYIFALKHWKKVIEILDYLRDSKGMMIILVAHALVKPYNNPMTEPYDQYVMKLHEKGRAILKEWSDCIFFAGQQIFVKKVDAKGGEVTKNSAKVGRAVLGNSNILYTGSCPAFDAGNRYSLPKELPLEFGAFYEALPQNIQQAITVGDKK